MYVFNGYSLIQLKKLRKEISRLLTKGMSNIYLKVTSYYFYFERNYDVSKSKSPCFLLNKNIKFNKSETESKMDNPTLSFRKMNHVLQLI